ncbi:MAG: hypothetical protein ABSH49_04870, partial [Bryobacteraceae bacterium]
IARLRFADNASIKLLPDRKEAFIIGRKQCLNCLCQPTGQAQIAPITLPEGVVIRYPDSRDSSRIAGTERQDKESEHLAELSLWRPPKDLLSE